MLQKNNNKKLENLVSFDICYQNVQCKLCDLQDRTFSRW